MPDPGRDGHDSVLDVCRHGRGPSQFCPMCDRAEVGFEAGSSHRRGAIDLRDHVDDRVIPPG